MQARLQSVGLMEAGQHRTMQIVLYARLRPVSQATPACNPGAASHLAGEHLSWNAGQKNDHAPPSTQNGWKYLVIRLSSAG